MPSTPAGGVEMIVVAPVLAILGHFPLKPPRVTRVQQILEGRYSTKQKVTKHEFTFSGLVNCGHCGCAHVAEKKKGK